MILSSFEPVTTGQSLSSVIIMWLIIPLFLFIVYKVIKKIIRFMDDIHDIARRKKDD